MFSTALPASVENGLKSFKRMTVTIKGLCNWTDLFPKYTENEITRWERIYSTRKEQKMHSFKCLSQYTKNPQPRCRKQPKAGVLFLLKSKEPLSSAGKMVTHWQSFVISYEFYPILQKFFPSSGSSPLFLLHKGSYQI